jgi:hypothetical protein
LSWALMLLLIILPWWMHLVRGDSGNYTTRTLYDPFAWLCHVYILVLSASWWCLSFAFDTCWWYKVHCSVPVTNSANISLVFIERHSIRSAWGCGQRPRCVLLFMMYLLHCTSHDNTPFCLMCPTTINKKCLFHLVDWR